MSCALPAPLATASQVGASLPRRHCAMHRAPPRAIVEDLINSLVQQVGAAYAAEDSTFQEAWTVWCQEKSCCLR